jgi:drug/metabolite transporter (DMT)-like permease
MSHQRSAYIYASIAVFFWSTVASAFKISLRHLDVPNLLFYSSIASTIVLFSILLAQGKLRLLTAQGGRDFLRSMILGFLNPFTYYLILFKAYDLLPAQEAQPLNFTWAIMLVLLSIVILKQRIGFGSILGILISYFGAFVIATRGDISGLRFSNPTGVALAVGSAVIWSLFWIYNVKDERDDVVKMFMNFAIGLLFVSIILIVTSRVVQPTIQGLTGAVYVGLFEMGVTFVLWLKALKLSRTTAQVSNLIYLAPFLSLVLIHYLVGETIRLSTIVGLVIIVSGILIQQYSARFRVP